MLLDADSMHAMGYVGCGTALPCLGTPVLCDPEMWKAGVCCLAMQAEEKFRFVQVAIASAGLVGLRMEFAGHQHMADWTMPEHWELA